MRRPCAFPLLAPLLGLGCWAQPVATETESLTQGPPAPERRPPDPGQPAPAETHATVALSEQGAVVEPSYAPLPTTQRLLPGGVVVVARPWPKPVPGRAATALLRLALPVGTRSGPVGIAELTAHAVADVPDAASARPPLRQQILLLGGELRVTVGAQATQLDALVPSELWREALDALVLAVKTTPAGTDQIDRVRYRLLREKRELLAQRSTGELVARLARETELDAEQWVRELEDRTVEDVELLHRLGYQPAGAVLGLCLPGVALEDALAHAEAAVVPWAGAASEAVIAAPLPLAELRSGMVWADASTPSCQLALVARVPGLGEPQALETWVALECLSMEGIGGRLGEAGRSPSNAGLGLECRTLLVGPARYRALSTTGTAASVQAAALAEEFARKSLTRSPPIADEVRTAAARVRLRLLAEYADPAAWLDAATAEALRGRPPVDLGAILARLDNPLALSLEAAAQALAGRAPTLVVIGALPQAEVPAVQHLAKAFLAPGKAEVPSEAKAQIEAALPYLAAALRAVGGEARLREVTGYSASLTRRAPAGATLEETLWFTAEGHRLRRIRRVLATTIETVIGGAKSLERAGSRVETLEPAEAQNALDRAARHPLLLLAGTARAELQWRLVSVRRAGDREMAIVQLVDPARERLRIAIDIESGLVRTVETREWRPGLTGRVHVAEHWDDYRPSDGMRCPFHCTVLVDDAAEGVELGYQQARWKPPEPRCLELDGPARLDQG